MSIHRELRDIKKDIRLINKKLFIGNGKDSLISRVDNLEDKLNRALSLRRFYGYVIMMIVVEIITYFITKYYL